MSPSCNWRGQWLSLKDLASLMGKSYHNLYQVHRREGSICAGILLIRANGKLWARVDQSTYESLLPRIP